MVNALPGLRVLGQAQEIMQHAEDALWEERFEECTAQLQEVKDVSRCLS